MKNQLVFLSIGIAILASTALADSMGEAETKSVRAAALELIETTPKRVESEAIQRVFSARFYEVELKISQGPSAWQTVTLRIARSGDKYQTVGLPGSNADMPALAKFFNPEFRLTNRAQAELLQKALDQVYPISTFGDEKPPKEIRQEGTTWSFVRGKFFDDFKGFVVKTGEEGVIASIAYSLDIKAQ